MEQESAGHSASGIAVSDNIIFDKSKKTIHVYKQKLSPEDHIALAFASILEDLNIKYVVVAGYIAILFGRARRSDDIDFIAEPIDGDEFIKLCRKAYNRGFLLIQGDILSEKSLRKTYRDYLARGYGIRFMYKDMILPNIEFKLTNTTLHKYSIENSYKVILNNENTIRISPLELQIAFKLALGSSKDIGDAVFLYTLFKEVLDLKELNNWCNRLRVDCKILEGEEQVERQH